MIGHLPMQNMKLLVTIVRYHKTHNGILFKMRAEHFFHFFETPRRENRSLASIAFEAYLERNLLLSIKVANASTIAEMKTQH
jgi:hypothetical protein